MQMLIIANKIRYDHGNNNCTSILGGSDTLIDPRTGDVGWLMGEPFFAGDYVDFDIAARTASFANLEDPSDPSAATNPE